MLIVSGTLSDPVLPATGSRAVSERTRDQKPPATRPLPASWSLGGPVSLASFQIAEEHFLGQVGLCRFRYASDPALPATGSRAVSEPRAPRNHQRPGRWQRPGRLADHVRWPAFRSLRRLSRWTISDRFRRLDDCSFLVRTATRRLPASGSQALPPATWIHQRPGRWQRPGRFATTSSVWTRALRRSAPIHHVSESGWLIAFSQRKATRRFQRPGRGLSTRPQTTSDQAAASVLVARRTSIVSLFRSMRISSGADWQNTIHCFALKATRRSSDRVRPVATASRNHSDQAAAAASWSLRTRKIGPRFRTQSEDLTLGR